jgi:CubicO group peptidase (beta-lactamase class C family)
MRPDGRDRPALYLREGDRLKRPTARFSALTAAVCLLARPSGARSEPGSLEAFADSLMSAQLATRHIPGAVLAVVRDGRVALARGYGYADLEHRIPVDPERTMFRLASVSKLFTATAAMQLVEQGRLDLHADVNRYLRRFELPPAYPRPVTLFDLLTHTAGFDESNIARKAHDPAEVEPLGDYLARRLPPRVRPPGDLIAYSNHGMALAGYLVEVASGTPFERYVWERVFEPLGMAHSSFALVPDSAFVLAVGYEGVPPRRQAPDYTRTVPASMLSASGADVARFMIAHLERGRPDGARLLGDSTVALMQRREFTQHPLLAGIGLGFWERFQNGERGLWHDGDASGFASLLYLIPERRMGYFMAFNSRAGNRARREILAALLDRDFPRLRAQAPASDARAAGDARWFAGTYVDLRHARRSLEKIVSLARTTTVTAAGDGSLRLGGIRYVAIGRGVFESEDDEGRLAFRADRAGHVTHLFESRSIARVYERVPWYGTANAQLAWLLACVLAFVWHAASALYRAVFRRNRPAARNGAVERWVGRAAVIVSASNLAFLVGLGFVLAGAFGSLEYGIPSALLVVLAIPPVTTAATIVSLLAIVRSRRAWSGSKVRPALAIAAALAFAAWLAYWNLLGYRF